MYASSGYSTTVYSGLGTMAAGVEDAVTNSSHHVAMGFTCDAIIQGSSDLGGQLNVRLNFTCDAVLLFGAGGGQTATQPTEWTPDTAVTTTWVPEVPVTGSEN